MKYTCMLRPACDPLFRAESRLRHKRLNQPRPMTFALIVPWRPKPTPAYNQNRMRNWSVAILLLGLAATLAAGRGHWRTAVAPQAAAPFRDDTVTFLVTFGYLRDGEKDYSG